MTANMCVPGYIAFSNSIYILHSWDAYRQVVGSGGQIDTFVVGIHLSCDCVE